MTDEPHGAVLYGSKTNIIAGWSEKVLDFILLAEQGEGTLEKTIEQYTY